MTTEKKWHGTWPANCDYCDLPLTNHSTFFDAKTKVGPWGLFCPSCFEMLCLGLGTGYGQKYDSKTLVKLEG
jgi:hypothetical protein